MTDAGYPFVVKRLARGPPLSAAVELFRDTSHDGGVAPRTFVNGDGAGYSLIERDISFFEKQYVQVTANGIEPLELPPRATVKGLVDGRLLVRIHQAWTPHGGQPAVATVTAHAVVAETGGNVRGRGWVFTPDHAAGAAPGWRARRIALPADVAVDIAGASSRDDRAFLGVTGFIDLSTLWLADAASGQATWIKSLPAQFDASWRRLCSRQHSRRRRVRPGLAPGDAHDRPAERPGSSCRGRTRPAYAPHHLGAPARHPLLDMLNFETTAVGASRVGEYGSVSVSAPGLIPGLYLAAAEPSAGRCLSGTVHLHHHQ